MKYIGFTYRVKGPQSSTLHPPMHCDEMYRPVKVHVPNQVQWSAEFLKKTFECRIELLKLRLFPSISDRGRKFSALATVFWAMTDIPTLLSRRDCKDNLANNVCIISSSLVIVYARFCNAVPDIGEFKWQKSIKISTHKDEKVPFEFWNYDTIEW